MDQEKDCEVVETPQQAQDQTIFKVPSEPVACPSGTQKRLAEAIPSTSKMFASTNRPEQRLNRVFTVKVSKIFPIPEPEPTPWTSMTPASHSNLSNGQNLGTPNINSSVFRQIYTPEVLIEALLPSLKKLMLQDPEYISLEGPDDPIELGILDYLDVSKKPMDLKSIAMKLLKGKYSDPWDYFEDVRLVFYNDWLFDRENSRVYRYCPKLFEVFKQEIVPVTKALGHCCGQNLTFDSQVLVCFGSLNCTVLRDAYYFSCTDKNLFSNSANTYVYCQKCFNNIPGDIVKFGDHPLEPQIEIKKNLFRQMKNNHIEMEPFVSCKDCKRKQHQICVLHNVKISPGSFICDSCLEIKGQKRWPNKFDAKSLPTSKLGSYIETRVNNFLKKMDACAGDVYIRVVSSSDHIVEVKPRMKARFVDTGDMKAEFPYRAKALLAFQEVEGKTVCFFGMHVQEYGDECPRPNTRRVYIANFDSVPFFKPSNYETAVHHEILLSYMNYVKQLGYTMAHIWACPPLQGDDYIFHRHPPEQEILKPQCLHEWYSKMLVKGISEGIIQDHKDISKQAMEDKMGSAYELPYFEGDFWPNVMEESIKELEQEKRNNLSDKVFACMEKYKELFFVIRLRSAQSAAILAPMQDPDPLYACDLMDGRGAFLKMARDNHYEFSSLRRAQFSTLSLLDKLHTKETEIFVYKCFECKKYVDSRDHFTDYDYPSFCLPCRERNVRCRMNKVELSRPQPGREASIRGFISSLIHAKQCLGNCHQLSCQKLKLNLSHIDDCDNKPHGGCLTCKHLIALCCYHVKNCIENECPVPLCAIIKQAHHQQKVTQRLQEQRFIYHRAAAMDIYLNAMALSSTSEQTETMPTTEPLPEDVLEILDEMIIFYPIEDETTHQQSHQNFDQNNQNQQDFNSKDTSSDQPPLAPTQEPSPPPTMTSPSHSNLSRKRENSDDGNMSSSGSGQAMNSMINSSIRNQRSLPSSQQAAIKAAYKKSSKRN